MAWFLKIAELIKFAIKYGPALFTMIRELLSLINAISDKEEKAQLKDELKKTADFSKAIKSPAPLLYMHKKIYQRQDRSV